MGGRYKGGKGEEAWTERGRDGERGGRERETSLGRGPDADAGLARLAVDDDVLGPARVKP